MMKLRNILIEIGEGNSKPYNFKKRSNIKYTFIASFGNNVKEEIVVDFENLNLDKNKKDLIVPLDIEQTDNMYNVGYKIVGNEFQFKKTNISVLLRILSTVVEVIKDFVRNNSPDLLYVVGTGKNINGDITTKNNLYKLYRNKQMGSFHDYISKDYHEGFIIYKKEH